VTAPAEGLPVRGEVRLPPPDPSIVGTEYGPLHPPAPAEGPTCCDLACYEDAGCECDGCKAAAPAEGLDAERLLAHLYRTVRTNTDSQSWRNGVEYAIECIEAERARAAAPAYRCDPTCSCGCHDTFGQPARFERGQPAAPADSRGDSHHSWWAASASLRAAGVTPAAPAEGPYVLGPDRSMDSIHDGKVHSALAGGFAQPAAPAEGLGQLVDDLGDYLLASPAPSGPVQEAWRSDLLRRIDIALAKPAAPAERPT